MARPRLNLTPEERRERKERARLKANARQEVCRAKKRELQMAQKVAAEMAEMEELYELAEELLQMRLPAAIEVVANWRSETRREFPPLFMEPRAAHETMPAFHARREKARKLGLIRLMAMDHVRLVGDRRRKADFEKNELDKAVAHGMTVDAYRKHKKGKRLYSKMEKIIADRAAA